MWEWDGSKCLWGSVLSACGGYVGETEVVWVDASFMLVEMGSGA